MFELGFDIQTNKLINRGKVFLFSGTRGTKDREVRGDQVTGES